MNVIQDLKVRLKASTIVALRNLQSRNRLSLGLSVCWVMVPIVELLLQNQPDPYMAGLAENERDAEGLPQSARGTSASTRFTVYGLRFRV